MRSLLFATAVVALLACQSPGLLDAPTGPGTIYPCGVWGVTCSRAMCCAEDDVCGGDDPTCPAGVCCYVGEPSDGHMAGARRMHPQTPQRAQ